MRAEEAAFSQTEVLAEAIVPLLSSPLTEPKGWHHIWVSINLSNTVHPTLVISLNPAPPNLWVHPKMFPMVFPYKQPLLDHASDFPKISQTSSIWPLHTPYPLLSGSRPRLVAASLSSQLGLFHATPSPAQVAAIWRFFCSSCCVTSETTQVVAELGHSKSNQGSTTRGRCTQPTQWHTSTTQPVW